MDEAIEVQDLSKTYRVPVREGGLGAAMRSLVSRQYREVEAVHSVSFSVQRGEVVGFLGPNGAGKTTTLKMLSGILHPTAGEARVLGFVPWRRQYTFLRAIAMVRGSRPLGAPPELTVLDALQFQRLLYEVPDHAFRRSLGELTDILDLEPLLTRQVRGLSLGERMRTGLAYALVYRPRVLFLDEPTVGLDVSAAMAMRGFIAAYSRQVGAAVLLTSHHMADVESLCRRVVLVDHGRLVYDGDLMTLSARLAPHKLLEITLSSNAAPDWQKYGETVSGGAGRAVLRVLREQVPAATARVLADLPVADLSVQEPPLESVIDRVYRSGVAV